MQKRNLHEWALAAEIIGGIAVVVTLIFLVIETRENTNAIQTQTYLALTAELNVNRQQASSEEMTDIALKYNNGGLESLSEIERFRLNMFTEAKWGIFESAFYARERGILGEHEWVRFSNAICRNYEFDEILWDPVKHGIKIVSSIHKQGIAKNITPLFREYVESSCLNN